MVLVIAFLLVLEINLSHEFLQVFKDRLVLVKTVFLDDSQTLFDIPKSSLQCSTTFNKLVNALGLCLEILRVDFIRFGFC